MEHIPKGKIINAKAFHKDFQKQVVTKQAEDVAGPVVASSVILPSNFSHKF